jgi:hypothetical protein
VHKGAVEAILAYVTGASPAWITTDGVDLVSGRWSDFATGDAGGEAPVDLHFHDLRGTAVTLLSEAGCTPQQVATITGHSLMTVHRILERYLARTRGLADQAIFNFENSPRTKFANQLQTGTDANARATVKSEP